MVRHPETARYVVRANGSGVLHLADLEARRIENLITMGRRFFGVLPERDGPVETVCGSKLTASSIVIMDAVIPRCSQCRILNEREPKEIRNPYPGVTLV